MAFFAILSREKLSKLENDLEGAGVLALVT